MTNPHGANEKGEKNLSKKKKGRMRYILMRLETWGVNDKLKGTKLWKGRKGESLGHTKIKKEQNQDETSICLSTQHNKKVEKEVGG